MNTVNSLPFSSSSPHNLFATKLHTYKPPHLSFSTPKRRRSSRPLRRNTTTKPNPYSYTYNNNRIITISTTDGDDESLRFVLDFHRISTLASSKLRWFLDSGREACSDLRNLVRIAGDDRRFVVVSCRRSTVQFFGGLVVLGFLLGVVSRVLVKLGSALFRGRSGSKPRVVVRRDRSLGGKEVVVAVDSIVRHSNSSRSPVSSSGQVSGTIRGGLRATGPKKLPKWWPDSVPAQTWVDDKEEYRREANRLIREIIDNRTSGKDITEDDIIRVRRVCRTAGIKVSIDPINTRDSFYRTSIDFVLNICCRAPLESTSVQIDGEDARELVSGLAENIKLENIDAARMALEIQGRHSESMLELSKICLVHRIFPPEESSPEMEMVARGLEKLMKVEEREFLLKKFVRICSEENHRSAAEALGLVCP